MKDICGVCGGNGTSCLDCSGTPNGTKTFDQCGVCNGNGTSCLDCAGNVFGTKQIDQCGVCGGDGKSCLDCAGQINGTSVVDRCGVCNGDGSTCLGCTQVNARDTILVLDGTTREQRDTIRRLARELLKKEVSASFKKQVKAIVATADQSYLLSWQIVWALPAEISVCTNALFCVQNSTEPELAEYKGHAIKLRKLGLHLVRQARRELRSSHFALSSERRIKKDYELSLRTAGAFPQTRSSCS